MSDKQTSEQTANIVVRDDVGIQQPNFSQPIVIERKNSSGRGLATGALALSVIALGASGFLFVQGQNIFQMQQIKISQELDKAALGESENARKLATSLDEQEKLNTMVGQLDVGQRQNRKHLADIQRAYQELLKGRVNWLVDEIEVTLNLASQQLVLSGNVPVAIAVLESIEQRLNRFEQSELLPIKRAISQDLSVLKQNAGSYLDISGTVLKLDSLEKAVPGLPLVVDSTLQAKPTQAAPVAESADFWTRTWNKTLSMLQSMVEIRKFDSNDAMLLAPEQIYFVRANLRLRLLDARLALMQHNNESYKNNLAVVESTVKQYFDTSSPTTKQWLADLSQLNKQNLSIVSDDVLKDSQAAVRDYQNKTRTAVPVNLTPVEDLPAVMLGAMAVDNAAQAAALPQTPVSAPASEETVKAVSAPKAEEASKPASPEPTEEKKAESLGKSETGKQRAVGLAVPAAVLAALAESAQAEPVKSESVQSAVQAAAVGAVAGVAAQRLSAEKDKKDEARETKREQERKAARERAREREREKAERRRREERESKRENREREKAARPKREQTKPKADAAPAPSGSGHAEAQP